MDYTKEHFNIKIKEKKDSFYLENKKEFLSFYNYFEQTFYIGKTLQDKKFNEDLWEEFAYQIDNYNCENKLKKNYIILSTFIGQIIFRLHLDHLHELKKVQGKILTVPTFNSPLAYHEALMQYKDKLADYREMQYDPKQSIMNKLIDNIPNKLMLFKNPFYACTHVYGCNFVFCTFIERLMILKFRLKLKEFLIKRYKKQFRHKHKITIPRILDLLESTCSDISRIKDLRKIFDDDKPITLTYLIKIGFFQKCIDNNFLKVLQALFYEDSLNLRNNMAHLNFKGFDYFSIEFSSTLLQILIYVTNNDFIDVKNMEYILN